MCVLPNFQNFVSFLVKFIFGGLSPRFYFTEELPKLNQRSNYELLTIPSSPEVYGHSLRQAKWACLAVKSSWYQTFLNDSF